LQQGFGRNTAYVGAGAAGGWAATGVLPFVDTGDIHTELGGANRSDIAAGTGTDDDDIKCFAHDLLPNISYRKYQKNSNKTKRFSTEVG
jgi:hypothetical protein